MMVHVTIEADDIDPFDVLDAAEAALHGGGPAVMYDDRELTLTVSTDEDDVLAAVTRGYVTPVGLVLEELGIDTSAIVKIELEREKTRIGGESDR